MTKPSFVAFAAVSAAVLSACSGMSPSSGGAMAFKQDGLPEAVRVPAGNRVVLETVGVGEITYECRAKANAADAFEWAFVGPKADLNSRSGTKLGSYFGPPATWASTDGSQVTGMQLAVAPSGDGNIPSQLVKANPATGPGAMMGRYVHPARGDQGRRGAFGRVRRQRRRPQGDRQIPSRLHLLESSVAEACDMVDQMIESGQP